MKNKISIYILLPLITILTWNACDDDDFLDQLPKGVAIAKTTSDFRKLLDNVDNERFPHSFSQTSAYLDVLTDNVSVDSTDWASWRFTAEHFQELFTFKDFVFIYDNLRDDPNWKPSFYIASLSSTILEEINKVTDNDNLKKQLIAETKVHRAYGYLTLVNVYAKTYNESSASSDLGVPIVTLPSALPSLERSSVQEVYDFILKDLNEAIEDLPEDVDIYNHRPTKTAAYAILARAYLYMGNYEKAFEFADKSLQIRNFLYDLNTEYSGADPYYTAITKISRTTDQEILLHKTTTQGFYSRNYNIIDTLSFDNIYPGFTKMGSNYTNLDLRRTLWFRGWDTSNTIKESNNAYHFVYYGNHSTFRYGLDNRNADRSDNIPITTAEMYVTRAEASARLGNLGQAISDINFIGRKRYKTGTYVDFSSNNQNEVISAVLAERRRELYGKDLRLFDVKRLNVAFSHKLGSATINVPANDSRLIHPIWDGYLEQNPEIEQNDRSNTGVTIN
ncbi:RagB/SusD family nutrient uptake outer membrane protein [uncultured Polaribacter sp.]|uniref:RagB/SusD family nutrient uptake outer membrane protein n=1 Tax=uncultured Polaribacter sp. TaxID=174711 RepID=UPI00261C2819|nr:RagB/SusD family nutrient uptake outer membrane protein [uncultured Polaribacter sp.]